MRKGALFYPFTNLFKLVWLNIKHWICISVSAFSLLGYHTSCSLQKTLLYAPERMRLKGR